MKAILIFAIVFAALPAVGGPIAGIHWDWSPKTLLVQEGRDGLQEEASYQAFSWQLGHAWRTETSGRGSLQLRYTRRSIARKGIVRWVQGPFPHALYTLSLGARWSHRWGTAYESDVFLLPVLENASETTIGLKDVKFASCAVS